MKLTWSRPNYCHIALRARTLYAAEKKWSKRVNWLDSASLSNKIGLVRLNRRKNVQVGLLIPRNNEDVQA